MSWRRVVKSMYMAYGPAAVNHCYMDETRFDHGWLPNEQEKSKMRVAAYRVLEDSIKDADRLCNPVYNFAQNRSIIAPK